jgi:MscS family membrane protein
VGQLLKGPVRLILWLPLFSLMTTGMLLSISVRIVLHGLERAILVVALAWAAVRLVDVFAEMLSERLPRTRGTGAISLLSQGRKTAKIFIVIVAAIAALQSFGFNVTALLAGLGVGGVAVALAAQKTLENIIAGVALYADRPVQIGDFCRFGDQIGTVEEIGMRSTRVRTLERTVVAVPNSEFASLQLDNFTRRDKIWFHPRISVRYETTPDQIRYILVEGRKMLYAHPRVEQAAARIRFAGFGAYSLDLDVFGYVTAIDYGEYLDLAFPTKATYVESGPASDRAAAAEASATVERWREQKELYLPRFPADKIHELRGSLDYPPQGSPILE